MTVIHTYMYRVMAGIYTVYIYIVINMTSMASSYTQIGLASQADILGGVYSYKWWNTCKGYFKLKFMSKQVSNIEKTTNTYSW